MEVHSSTDAEAYAAAVADFLERDPCARNVLRWIIELARTGAGGWDAPPSFHWATDGGVTVAAASWTPPHAMLVSAMPDAFAAALVAAVRLRSTTLGVPVRGVNGPAGAARRVADAWTAATGEPARLHMAETLYELTRVEPTPRPPGERRAAGPGDVRPLAEWLEAFALELGLPVGSDARGWVRHQIEQRSCDVWVDGGEVVSMAGHRRPIAGVVRVGPVYTPPARRGRGYARRLVAEVSEAALAAGAARCMLFTDTANPVSNSIYRQIGYVPGEEHADIVFAR